MKLIQSIINYANDNPVHEWLKHSKKGIEHSTILIEYLLCGPIFMKTLFMCSFWKW